MKSLTILAVCGAGLGSSFACEMSIEAALKEMGVKANLAHCDISSAASTRADIIMTGANFKPQFENYTLNSTVIYLKRLVDKKEITEKLTPILKDLGYLN
ncbi:PTS sugar transporter subunit IIB [Rouxiella chamberiensis]|uniref:PTS sugar transporter subunit IIB n=1 Tax=Rouxiella chamberiensis TaxID=1513468 RepID=A0ABY7HRE9_9GAMM|nr:PTS sugar transporter subunit IIB [Rouxiella chamberiensis]WAT01587.1 PTS sugar transporter subunit IIB [Rouxiella chamberiensis]